MEDQYIIQSGKEEDKKLRCTSKDLILLITVCFGSFCDEACFSLQAPFFPREAENKGVKQSIYGLIFGLFQLSVFLFAPIVEKLIVHVDPKVLLNVGIATVGLANFFFGLLYYVHERATFIALACSLRILEGVGAATFQVSSYSIIGSRFSQHLAMSFAAVSTLEGLGALFGPLLGGVLYDFKGFSLPFYFLGSMAVLDAVLVFFIVPKQGKTKPQEKYNRKKFWMSPVTIVYAALVFSVFNYLGFTEATLEPHIRELGLSGLYIGLLFAADGVIYTILSPICGWICDKNTFASKVLCLVGCHAMVVSLFLIGPMPFLGLRKNVFVILGSLLLFGVGDACKLVAVMSACVRDTVARGFPDDIATYSLVSSMFVSAESLGCFVGPSLGGYIVENMGYNFGTYYLATIEGLVAIFLVLYIFTAKLKMNKEACFNLPPQLQSSETCLTTNFIKNM